MAERHHVGNVVLVCFADSLFAAESAFVFRGFVAEQVALAGAVAHDFAGGGDFEPLGGGLLGLG